jgi:hypothetical protein
MAGTRGTRWIVTLAVVGLAIACAGCTASAEAAPPVEAALAATGVPAASIPCGAPGAPASVAASAPAGWTDVVSPWLGYAVAVPASWGLRGHVSPDAARAPYDVFEGTIPGTDVPGLLVVGCNPVTEARAAGAFLGHVSADGTALDLYRSPADEPGRVILFAKGVRDDTEWHLMALVPSDGDGPAFFRDVVATFRFPVPASAGPAGG